MHSLKFQFWTSPLVVLLVAALIMLPMLTVAAESGNPDDAGSAMAAAADDGGEPEPAPAPQQTPRGRTAFVPGDAVQVSVFPDTSSFLNQTFPIDDRGFIDLPILGKAKISHMSTEEFKNFLRENYRDYQLPPSIQVRPLIRASVLGGVANPGLFYIDPDRSLWELMQLAGPLLNEDGLMKSRWDRDRRTLQEDLIPYVQSGISLERMGFRSGDQIWVATPGRPGTLDRVLRVASLLTIPISVASLIVTLERRN